MLFDVLYSVKISILVSTFSLLVGCNKLGVNSAQGTNSGGQTPTSCKDWILNDAEMASEFKATLIEGASVSATQNSIQLSYSGTMPTYTANGSAIPTAGLYARKLPSTFTLRFKADSLTGDTTELASFIALQNATSGLRWSFTKGTGGNVDDRRITWHSTGHFAIGNTSETAASMEVSRQSVDRVTWKYFDSNGVQSGSGYADGFYGDFYLGFGIQNMSNPGVEVTGQITSQISLYEITTNDPTCDADGFE